MKILISSDKQIRVNAAFTDSVRQQVENALERFASRVTRIEVHLSDINSVSKHGGADKRCFIEARPAGDKPVVVSDDASEVEAALRGAVNKLKRLLTTRFSKAESAVKRSSVRPAKDKRKAAVEEEVPVIAPTKKAAKKKTVVKAKSVTKPGAAKKTPISQQRRKAQPSKRGR